MYSIDTLESANTNSALAQVGQIISPVPVSQKAENAAWMDWLEHPTSALSSDKADDGSQEPLEEPRISPGISERYQAARKPSQPLPTWGNETPTEADVGASTVRTPSLSNPPSSSDCSRILDRYEDLIFKIGQPQKHPELDVSRRQSYPDRGSFYEEGDNTHVDAIRPKSPMHIQRANSGQSEADLDEAWKTFVFGDENIDEVEEEAFNDAKHDAARDLQPSDFSASVTPKPMSELDSNVAAAGTMYSHANHDETSEDSGASADCEATFGPSSASEASDPASSSSSSGVAIRPQSIKADAGSSTSEIEGHTINDFDDNLAPTETEFIKSIIPEAPTSPTSKAASVVTSVAIEVTRSEAGPREPHFRFARPKPFVGNRSVSTHMKRPAEAVAPFVSLTKKRRGWQRKRAHDGRADIRALPNYSGDPIEDVEDDDDPSPPSLFGALELA